MDVITTIRRFLVSAAAAFSLSAGLTVSTLADDAHIGPDAAAALPLFDAHVRYKEPAWAPYPPGTVIELFDRSGGAMALVSATPDEDTIKLWDYAPEHVVPEIRPHCGFVGSSNWTKAEGMFDYIFVSG